MIFILFVVMFIVLSYYFSTRNIGVSSGFFSLSLLLMGISIVVLGVTKPDSISHGKATHVDKVLNKEIGHEVTITYGDSKIVYGNALIHKSLLMEASIVDLEKRHKWNLDQLKNYCNELEKQEEFSWFSFAYLYIDESDFCSKEVKKLYKGGIND